MRRKFGEEIKRMHGMAKALEEAYLLQNISNNYQQLNALNNFIKK